VVAIRVKKSKNDVVVAYTQTEKVFGTAEAFRSKASGGFYELLAPDKERLHLLNPVALADDLQIGQCFFRILNHALPERETWKRQIIT
jgi:hypothetical protein